MLQRYICIALIATSLIWSPTTLAAEHVPKQLSQQLERLLILLSDGYAVGYPNATMYRPLGLTNDGAVVLVVLTVEGWGGGNNFTQFLAAFRKVEDRKGREYFTFIDAMPVGGGGWRQVEQLEVNILSSKTQGESLFSFPVKVNAEQDAPNFPSKKSTAVIALNGGKLKELNAR